jgi:hypothetical protein
MQSGDRSARRERIEDAVNYLMGFGVLMKGIAKLDEVAHHPLAVPFLFAAGLFILGGTFFRRPLERRVKGYFELFHLAEGVALWVVGLLLREAGRQLVWALFLFAGTLYLVVGLMHGVMHGPSGQRIGLILMRSIGVSLLIAATLLVVFSGRVGVVSAPHVAALIMAVIGTVSLIAMRGRRAEAAPVEPPHAAPTPPDPAPPA